MAGPRLLTSPAPVVDRRVVAGLATNVKRRRKAAWRRVRTIFREERADNVAFVFCPTWLAFQTGRVSSFWPGDSMVDWVAVDGYARPSNDHAPLTELFPWFYDSGSGTTSR
ncbi:hypothetical protein [Micromonospora sp. NPDC004551]|uniref:hypothetical protein n=1 Tax=Micromonospora sp. NPDC004551 TaxID=3154284 RepID=UPI0033AB3250